MTTRTTEATKKNKCGDCYLAKGICITCSDRKMGISAKQRDAITMYEMHMRHKKAQEAAIAMHELRTGRKTPDQKWGEFD